MKNILLVSFLTLLTAGCSTQKAPAPTPTPVDEQRVSLRPPCVPTFVDGGGPYYKLNAPKRSELAPKNSKGEVLFVTGRVLANDCATPVANVTVDIWQANESGSYEDEWYRGQITSNDRGEYAFSTVIPKGYGEGTGYRPPHIHFKIWKDGKEIITSQMFLPASRAQGIEEPYIMTLTKTTEDERTFYRGTHDIILP